jgi:diguanylate cyclase (GGDEF)-like protein
MDGDTDIMGMPSAGEAPTSRYLVLLRQLGAWSPGAQAAVIHVDLRNLRDINRLSGASEGDRLIRRVEQLLLQWGRGHAVTGRLWSNEFIAAKAIDHTQAAGEDANALRDLLSELQYDSAVGPARIGVSLGLAVYRQGDDWARVLSEASQACLLAKRRGLNQIVRFGSGLSDMPIYSPSAVSEFRSLMKAGRLCLHAQPIMDISGEEPRMAKAEFLIRMERNGVHMPLAAGIIETLEHYGLVAELDRFSSSFLLDWLDTQPEIFGRVHGLSMNLSGASLVDGRFMDDLYRDVKNARLPAGKLCFEITETSAIQHLDVAAEVIAAFKSLGCLFSLDDFGSGLCSFGYLNSLPVDEVKIDGRFVRDIAQSAVSQEITRAIHHVAKVTGKKTVAEFVDDARKLEALQKIGVDYAQGWLFYPAVAPEKLLELLPK